MKLLTRSGLDWTAKFGKDLAAAFKALPVGTALIDGELVVENQNGASDFSLLQADLSEGRADRFVYYAFDLLHLDGYDLRATPLVMRKEALAQLLAGERGILRYSEHFEQDGDLILQHACRLSLEGIISKLRDGALPLRPRQELGQVQMLAAPGIRGRRLCAVDHLAQGHRLPGARLLR